MPKIPFRKIGTWFRERSASVWENHRETAAKVGKKVAIAGAFALIVLLIHRELYSFLSRQDRYAIDPGDLPTAVKPRADEPGADPGSVVSDIHSTLDDKLVRRVAKAFEKNPWVKRVTAVTRVYPDKLHVELEYREPYLAVNTPEGIVLLDDEFVRLPGLYEMTPDDLERPVVTGVKGAGSKAGKIWRNRSLRHGRELADLCVEIPMLRALGIREVDVADSRGAVELIAKNGCAIRWGRPESMADPAEIPVEEKISNLRIILHDFPRLDGLEYAILYIKGKPTIRRRDSRNASNK